MSSMLFAGGSPWDGWLPATCLPDACFCEAIGSGLIRQPINTWSNLAFVAIGLLIAFDLRPDRSAQRSNLISRPMVRRLFALAVIAIGLGSMVYHASLSFVGQWLDVMSMYLLGVFMVLYAAARLRPSGSFRGISAPMERITGRPLRFLAAARLGMTQAGTAFAIGYITINLALGLLLIVWPEARRYVFGALIVIALGLEMILQRRRLTTANPRRLIAALGVYVMAQIIWTLDLNHIICDPTSVLQGHAVWHVLTAASAGLMYLYYQSETRETE